MRPLQVPQLLTNVSTFCTKVETDPDRHSTRKPADWFTGVRVSTLYGHHLVKHKLIHKHHTMLTSLDGSLKIEFSELFMPRRVVHATLSMADNPADDLFWCIPSPHTSVNEPTDERAQSRAGLSLVWPTPGHPAPIPWFRDYTSALAISGAGVQASICMSGVLGATATRGEKRAYFKCWVVKCIPVTDTVSHYNGIRLSKRLFTPEKGRSRGTVMNTRVLQ